jgi:hypothetical protein
MGEADAMAAAVLMKLRARAAASGLVVDNNFLKLRHLAFGSPTPLEATGTVPGTVAYCARALWVLAHPS